MSRGPYYRHLFTSACFLLSYVSQQRENFSEWCSTVQKYFQLRMRRKTTWQKNREVEKMINLIITNDWKGLCGMSFLMSKTDTIVGLPLNGEVIMTSHRIKALREILTHGTWGSHSGLLGSDATQAARIEGTHNLRGRRPRLATNFLLVTCLSYFSSLKMEAVRPSGATTEIPMTHV